jgi:hypothetical protein
MLKIENVLEKSIRSHRNEVDFWRYHPIWVTLRFSEKSEFDSTPPYDLALFEWFLGHIRPTCTLPNLVSSAYKAYMYTTKLVQECIGGLLGALTGHLGVI